MAELVEINHWQERAMHLIPYRLSKALEYFLIIQRIDNKEDLVDVSIL